MIDLRANDILARTTNDPNQDHTSPQEALSLAYAKRVCSDRFSYISAPIGAFGAQINQPLVAQLDTFEASFRWAVEQAERGDIVLLSAGCASFGWFANYRDRGEQFTRLVSQV